MITETNFQLPATDGFMLTATSFSPDTEPTKIVVIASATGVKRAYYAAFARFLANEGYQVYSFDYRGVGDSRPPQLKGFAALMQHWGEYDLNAMLDKAKSLSPDKKLIVVGHSAGGQMIGLSKHQENIEKIVLVASQSGYWKHWKNLKQRANMAFNWAVLIPILCKIFGYLPSKKITEMEDLPAGVATQWANWSKSPNYLFDHLPNAYENYARFEAKLLAYSFSDDTYAPYHATKWLLAQYKNTTITHKHLTPQDLNLKQIGHFAFFREKFKPIFWQEVADFIAA